MKKNYLVKDKTAVSEIICVTGVERDPSNAFEAATALAEVIKPRRNVILRSSRLTQEKTV